MGTSMCRSTKGPIQRWGTAVAMVLLVLVNGCDRGPTAEKSTSITGKVVEKGTQVPVDSAWLVIEDTVVGAKFYSDSEGHFTLAVNPFTAAEPILAGKSGYETTVIDTFESLNHDISGLLIELEKSNN